MEPSFCLTAVPAAEVDSVAALQLRVLQLQYLIGELLQKNQELREHLAAATTASVASRRVSISLHPA